MIIKGIPDEWNIKGKRNLNIVAKKWIDSISADLTKCVSTINNRITVDLSNINFISAYEWSILIAIINRVLTNSNIEYLDFDLVGESKLSVIDPKDYIKYLDQNDDSQKFSKKDFNFSHRIYQLSGFIEACGTRNALLKEGRIVYISYPWIKTEEANFIDFYSYKDSRPTVFLGLTRIDKEESCSKFLADDMVVSWKNSLREKFHNSPILETEEIWRSICHELATNIWEHSNSEGFLFYRVIKPIDQVGNIRWWCRKSFEDSLSGNWKNYKKGFLEICAVDSGNGFVKSLKESFLKQKGISDSSEVEIFDILSFAFDEFGTCKTDDESWVLTRHALGRILLIVSKYGGVITLRSDGTEIKYISTIEGFVKKQNGLGYIPSVINSINKDILGSHIQILLPLYPENFPIDFKNRDTIFKYLPNSYTLDPNHVRGHLVPVLEAIGFSEVVRSSEDIRKFRASCLRLNNSLKLQNPPNEPLVFDFSGTNWAPPQFETFLFLFQNIIQKRLILLVEIDPRLAKAVIDLENQLTETFIDKEVLGKTSEMKFFETYTGINHAILGIDKNGIKYLFGLSDNRYEKPLLSLIDTPDSIEGVCNYIDGNEENQAYCKTILTKENQLFYLDDNNRWNCSWDIFELNQQANRIISEHFDLISKRTEAWQGKYFVDDSNNLGFDYPEVNHIINKKFNLPWQEEWRESFLESSKFLSRERYCDEAAQRLIYRLQCGLKILNKAIEDINVLVCVTAPALMLASSMHRWWPISNRPIVADLSYNVLLENSYNLPSVVEEGGIVIVQDIFERGKVSGELYNKLKKQTDNIICAISLLRFNDSIQHTRVTQVEQGWSFEEHEILNTLPNHSLIELPGPKKCPPPNINDDDSELYWIEPCSLHPTSYKHLRREFGEGRDPYIKRRDSILPEFDNPNEGCLFTAGHYVYGHRHYQVAINVKKMLAGKIGKRLAVWIADICEGSPLRQKAEWERNRGFNLKGDVTFVLMPLHSQIHYLWPEVKRILAQRNRRQLMSLLDATLFTGRRPTYRISDHLEQQLKIASLDAIKASKMKKEKHPSQIRLLLLDDAIASARSAETILLSITNRVSKIFNKAGEKIEDLPTKYHPIEWIRYFAVLNQMGHANQNLWHDMENISNPSIKFILEEYAPFMGVPLFEEKDCPFCSDIKRLKQLISKCHQFGSNRTAEWALDNYKDLKPVAIDGIKVPKKNPVTIQSGIDILGLKSKRMASHPSKYISKFADTAIWRFYKFMHLSYPIDDILQNINKWWEFSVQKKETYDIYQSFEYTRYRWAVIDWCIKNWSRVKASTARKTFIECINYEIFNNTNLVEKCLNGCSLIYRDTYVVSLIKNIIKEFENLELQRKDADKVIDEERIARIDKLEIGITSFFLSIPEVREENQQVNEDEEEQVKELLSELEKSANKLRKTGTNLIGNLYTRLIRPRSVASPKWALNAVAENLFRGRDPKNAPAGRHHLLPRVIHDNFSKKRNIEDLMLLEGSLSVFLAALQDISPYANISMPYYSDTRGTQDVENVKILCLKLINWLKSKKRYELLEDRPSELRQLYDSLDLNGNFVKGFNAIFQVDIGFIKSYLLNEIQELKIEETKLKYIFEADKYTLNSTVLCYINSFLNILVNHTIDPIKKKDTNHQSMIKIFKENNEISNTTPKIVFRLLTNFETLEITNKKIFETGRGLRELKNIEIFGACITSAEWISPTIKEIEEGFTSSWEILVPTGYLSGGH